MNSSVTGALAAMGLALGMMPNQAKAATSYYFDVNGNTSGLGSATNNSTYNWSGSMWNTSSTGAVNPAAWVSGGFARFTVGAANVTYTVNVASPETMAGLFNTVGTSTINFTGSGNFTLSSGVQGFLNSSSCNMQINIPMTGAGGFEPENGGSISVNASNSYTGGTVIASTSTLTYFNNGNAFGTGSILIEDGVGSFCALLGTAGATTTIPNQFDNNSGTLGDGLNFAANNNTPIISTGTWSLGANTLNLRSSGGNVASSLSLKGKITGSAGIILSSNTGAPIIFSGANTYTGTTTITGVGGGTIAGSAATTLKLGAANTIASSTAMVLSGGILDPDGFNQNMSSTTLALNGTTTTSQITYSAGNVEVDFANSSAVAWTSGDTLNLTNWTTGMSLLRFGTDNTGLTSAQLADIEFNGDATTKGTAQLTAAGYVVPEPTSIAMLLLGAPMLAARRRRRH